MGRLTARLELGRPMKNLRVVIDEIKYLGDQKEARNFYFAILRFNRSSKYVNLGNDIIRELFPNGSKLSKWFSLEISPVFSIPKGAYWHAYINKYPIYDGDIIDPLNIYVAVMETKGSPRRDIMKSLLDDEAIKRGIDSLTDFMGDTAWSLTKPDSLKTIFSLLIKLIETSLINAQDDIRYTNVFTFRDNNGFLAIYPTQWYNQNVRIKLLSTLGEQRCYAKNAISP
jgi:hypothetical protein